MAERQKPWDQYEAVVLLEGYLDVILNGIPRNEVIDRVSCDLRTMAINQGFEIDDVFRNKNGITFQIKSMESAYLGYTVMKPASKLFAETVDLYKNNPNEYSRLREEASKMVGKSPSVEKHFLEYLSSQTSPTQFADYCACYAEIDAFCLKLKILKQPLFETIDPEVVKKVQKTIEQNKIFRITHKKKFTVIIAACRYYYLYIRDGLFSAIDEKSAPSAVSADEPKPVYELIDNVTSVIPVEQNHTVKSTPESSLEERLHDVLKLESERNNYGTTISYLQGQIRGGDREKIKAILDSVEWAKFQFGRYHYISNETPVIEASECTAVVPDNSTMPIDRTETDKRLLQKYPIIYKRLFSSLLELTESHPNGVSVSDLYIHINRVGRPAVIEEILDNVSWATTAGKNYIFSKEIVDHSIIIDDIVICAKQTETVQAQEHPTTSSPSGKVTFDAFFEYLAKNLHLAEKTATIYAYAIGTCESIAKKQGYENWQLYSEDVVTVTNTIEKLKCDPVYIEKNRSRHNQFSAALTKFIQFINGGAASIVTDSTSHEPTPVKKAAPYQNKPYEAVLKNHFKKGFRLESPLEVRKFRRYYSAIHNAELTDTDELISDTIKKLCIIYDGKAFLPAVMLSDELKQRLLHYIDKCFAEGKTAIYYQAIYTEFAEEFLDYHIYDAEMLKAYLTYVADKRFYINRSSISKQANVTLDPLSEIRSCLEGYGGPVEYEELFSALPHLPQDKVKWILRSNGEFINNGHGAYFHESVIVLSDEELDNIADIIAFTIEEKEFMGGNELYDAIKAKYPYIIENNQAYSVYGFRDALKYKLGDRFSFKGNIISRTGQELSMADVFANYAKHHDSFTLTELQSMATELATVIYFDSVYENCLRVSREQFVSKIHAQFTVPDTDAAIDRVCTGNYISIQDVTNFGTFPYAGFPWNGYLLEHYVAEYSRKYMLLHSNYNGTEYAGAIVKRSAGIQTFDDFIVDLLANNDVELKKAPALQFLSDNGYLARRRYGSIESLIIKANAQRNRKDTD